MHSTRSIFLSEFPNSLGPPSTLDPPPSNSTPSTPTNHPHPLKSPNRSTQYPGLTPPSPSPCPSHPTAPFTTPVNTHNVPPSPPSTPNLISVSSRSPTMHAILRSNRNLPSIACIISTLGFPSAIGFLPVIATRGAEMEPAPGKKLLALGKVVSVFVARKRAPRWR